MESFVCDDKDFVGDPGGDGKPVELLKDWGDVVPGFGVGEETGGCVLDQLEFIEEGGVGAVEE